MKIAVLSRGPGLYSTQRIVQSGQHRGHQMLVVDHMRCDLRIEKNNPEVYYFNRKLDNLDAIIPRIGSSATYYGQTVLRHFSIMDVYSTLEAESLLHARNKFRCYQILAAQGIRVPNTVRINQVDQIQYMLDKIGEPPYIVKLLNSTHGAGVLKAETRQQAAAIAEAFINTKQRLMLQEYIAEANGADLRVFIVDGEIVAAMKRQAQSGDFRSNLHRGGSSTRIKLTTEEQQMALKATNALGLSIAGVDLLQTSSGPLVLEVNASPGLEGIEGTSGVNIASKIIQMVERDCRNKKG